MADAFDVIVIGGGPAGYPAALRAAQNGLSVACIDEWKNHDGTAAFGGTCLNAGCIPSKALLESTELYHRLRDEFAVHGIRASGVELDLPTLQKRRAGIVKKMTDGIAALFKAGGVTPPALNSAAIPSVIFLTMPARRFCIAPRSSSTPEARMPCTANSSRKR